MIFLESFKRVIPISKEGLPIDCFLALGACFNFSFWNESEYCLCQINFDTYSLNGPSGPDMCLKCPKYEVCCSSWGH